MNYEKALDELFSAIEYSEQNTHEIFEIIETVSVDVDNELSSKLMDAMNLIQSHDIYTQKIQRVINFICTENNIDSSKYNIASSAKHIHGDDNSETMSADDIEALLKQMA